MKRHPARVLFVLPMLVLLLGGPAVQGFSDDGQIGSTDPEGVRNTVAARVNGAEIPVKYVTMVTNRLNAGKGQPHAAPDGVEGRRKTALNLLILRELAYQKADRKVEREEIDKRIASMKASLGGQSEYRKYLEKEALTEGEFTALLEKDIAYDRLLEKNVLGKVTVSEDDLKKAYERERDQFHTSEKIVAIDVVFFLEVGDKNSMKKAKEILGKITGEENKNPFLLAYDGSFLVREIELRKEKDGTLYEEAKKLKVDELSGVITTHDSLHIIKLKKYTPEKQFSFDQAKGMLERKLNSEARQKRMREWEAELKKDAKIEIMEAGSGKM